MSQIAIHAQGLSKSYQLSHEGNGYVSIPTIRDAVRSALVSPFQRVMRRGGESASSQETFWALQDISFDVQAGESVAIIGRNGTGKSTLLKMLSRIVRPTRGRADVYGRMGVLLEVGTGFHPELSGRENIYMNAAILGMKRTEINSRFDEIVSFAEVERFLDTPIKHYSSGMVLRLGFAVAAHLEPEILVVDEVLAVGDLAFQKKCLGKMSDTAQEGRTVLFVSHNLNAVAQLCTRGIWLDGGHVRMDGEVGKVIEAYTLHNSTQLMQRQWTYPGDAPGNERVRLTGAQIIQEGHIATTIDINKPCQIEIEFLALQHLNRLTPLISIYDMGGASMFTSADWKPNSLETGYHRATVHIPAQTLSEGSFSVRMMLFFVEPMFVCVDQSDALLFDTIDGSSPNAVRGPFTNHWPGAVRLALDWELTPLPATASGSPEPAQTTTR
ncbi:MAG: ABC transporter ATP-binding protein [Anaerolineae bacterium]